MLNADSRSMRRMIASFHVLKRAAMLSRTERPRPSPLVSFPSSIYRNATLSGHHYHLYQRIALFTTELPRNRMEDTILSDGKSQPVSPKLLFEVDDYDIDDHHSIDVSSEIYEIDSQNCENDIDMIEIESDRITNKTHASIPSTSSEAQVWQSWTEQVLLSRSNDVRDGSSETSEHPSVSLSHLALLIKWWARQRPFTDEAATNTWKLLDMVDQWDGTESSLISRNNNNHGLDSNNRTNTKAVVQNLINIVLDHWRLSITAPSVAVPYTAYEIWQRLQRQPPHMLTIRTFAIFVSAISRQNFDALPPHRKGPLSPLVLAIEVLEYYMSHRPESYTTKSEKISLLVLWNSILTVIAKQGRGPHVGEKAELMLREMQKDLAASQMIPDAISYACVLEGWVMAAKHNPNAGVNAERILQEMMKLLDENPYSSETLEERDMFYLAFTREMDEEHKSALSLNKAISICYLHVLRSYCNSDTPKGADQANYILQTVKNNYLGSLQTDIDDATNDDAVDKKDKTIYRNVTPTRHFFSAVMAGYADRGKPTEVERLLFELQALYEISGGDPLLFPTTATFNSVLDAFARQSTPISAERAQRLLEQLYSNAMKSDTSSSTSSYGHSNLRTCLPDTTSVNTCLHAWAQSGAPNAVERAEELLLETSKWPCIRPDPYSYTSVMKALANSNRPDAAERCEGILRHMWEQYERDGPSVSSCKPNDVTYTTAIYCWSLAADNPDAPLRAEALFKDMRERYQNGDHTLKPTIQVYVSLILAWAHSSRREGDVRAQLYFDLMRGQYVAGDDSLRPNDKVYRALVESKRKRNDGEGAEMTLNHMYDDYLTHGNTGAMPTRFVYHGVMSAWVNSSSPNAYQRIESIVHRMQQEHQARKWDCKPTSVTYTILLSCLAKIGTKDSAIRAEKLLRHMYNLSATDDSVKPCSFSCTTVMQAWANTVGVHEAPLRAQAIFDDMIRLSDPPRGDLNIRPNSFTYNSLLTTWARSLHSDAGERSLSILQEMERHHKMDPKNFAAPNHFHYTAVISALANKGDVNNVENLLQYMIDHRIRPHSGTLNSVLKAYSRSSLPDAVDRAENLLRNMKAKYSVSPNYVSYTTFVLCIQRSQLPDGYRRAKIVVNEMIQKSMSMGWNPSTDGGKNRTTDLLVPNIVTFATLIVALKECTDTNVDKIKELDHIQTWMNQMDVEPNTTVQKDMLKIRLSTTPRHTTPITAPLAINNFNVVLFPK